MKPSQMRARFLIVASAAAVAASVSAQPIPVDIGSRIEPIVPRYRVIKLDAVNANDPSKNANADAINELGDVAGLSTMPEGDARTGLWLRRAAFGLPAGLHTLECPWSDGMHRAYGINNAGTVVGFAAPPLGEDGWARAYRWTPSEGMVNLGTLGSNDYGGSYSRATAVNEAGWVAGYSSVDDVDGEPRQFWHGFVFDGVEMRDLGTFSGVYSRALDINNAGQAVGFSTYVNPDAPFWDPLEGETMGAALWLPEPAYGLEAGLHDISIGHDEEWAVSAQAISDSGEVAMSWPLILQNGAPTTVLALWLPAPAHGLPAGVNVIGGFGGDDRAMVATNDMNDAGQVIGRFDSAPDNQIPVWHGFLYEGDGTWNDLADLVHPADAARWDLSIPRAINDRGEITGYGTHINSQGQGEWISYVLTPYPQPPGDFNRDGTTDGRDLDVLIANLGSPLGRPLDGDMDDDQDIDVHDVGLFVRLLAVSAGGQDETRQDGLVSKEN